MLCQNCILRTMVFLNKSVIYDNTIFSKKIRLFSTTINENLTEWNKIKSRYSEKQLSHVLNTLNKCNLTEIKKFDISENHIKVLESLQKKKKSYESLDDFILLDVIKAPQLERICSAIVTKKTKVSRKSSIVSPVIKKENLKNFKTAIGLRIGLNHVSWSQLELTGSNCNILKWDCQSVSDLSLNANITETIKMGVNIAKAIPNADAYVMERQSSHSTSKISTSMYRIQLRHQQLISIVLTVLSTRNNFKTADESSDSDPCGSFYFMRPFVPAQLFGLFVGNEIVSANEVIQTLFQKQSVGLKNILSLSADNDIENYYSSLSTYKQEELNKSLLLTLTFFELAVLEN